MNSPWRGRDGREEYIANLVEEGVEVTEAERLADNHEADYWESAAESRGDRDYIP